MAFRVNCFGLDQTLVGLGPDWTRPVVDLGVADGIVPYVHWCAMGLYTILVFHRVDGPTRRPAYS